MFSSSLQPNELIEIHLNPLEIHAESEQYT